ncbi:ABC transporter permease [Nitratireductor pacificus]|uniref:Binding-protein-dependent transporters inner membrane component n=1 Tax=Nitratireductor pacificus pht-3B TaxID=391937 RepID=K2MMU5_9HYPH|nr:ABC transporter permease [Nitratireductor pacificus]EKF18567.1 binding-protein-dependent transporters inner membrane component [Nitratireductor pacificus pht-3B]
MTRFLIQRLILAIVVVFAVASLTFFALNLSGDPISNALSSAGASEEQIAEVRQQLGYDRPILVQYADFIASAATGDFGRSIYYGEEALPLVIDRLPYTILLASVAMLITIVVAFPLGVAAAMFRDRPIDRAIVTFAAFGQSVPIFVVGPILILIFSVHLGILPVSGAEGRGSVILPALTLSLYPLARITRLLRASMLEVANSEYVLTARARGASEIRVVLRYILRNALLPVLTVLGLQLGNLLGGAVIVETVFAWPGIGSFTRDALINSDFPLAQTAVILIAVAVVVVNVLTDLIYSLVDPRIRLS